MRFFLSFFFLCATALADLQSHTQAITPQIQQHLVTIGRLGLLETRPGVVISEEGHVIAPRIKSVDTSETPYLLYHSNGSRQQLEIIEEDEKRPVVLLKLPEGHPINPAPLAPLETFQRTHHFYIPTLSPLPALHEPFSILCCARANHIQKKKPKPYALKIDYPILEPGTPIFNLNGHLTAMTFSPKRSREENAVYIPAHHITRFTSRFKALANTSLATDHKPIPHLQNSQDFRDHPAAGLILNGDKELPYSIGGLIIRSDGLILTKASELGPELIFLHRGKRYPATILSTDSSTDLALVGIAARNLPTVKWADPGDLKPGSLVYHKSLLPMASPEMAEMDALHLATFSHQLTADPVSIHQSSSVTSLGVVPEQINDHLTIAAIRPGSPAEKSDLRQGDILVSLDGTPLINRTILIKLITPKSVGDEVSLKIKRDGKEFTIKLALTAAPLIPATTGIQISGARFSVPSVVRGPFPESLVHTLPLNSWDCGTPLLGQNHEVYGFNIAAINPSRALAHPPSVIKAAIKRMTTSISF